MAKGNPPKYAELSPLNADEIAYYPDLGYPLVQYLEDELPGFLDHFFTTLRSLIKSIR
jgi:hypothetical protein